MADSTAARLQGLPDNVERALSAFLTTARESLSADLVSAVMFPFDLPGPEFLAFYLVFAGALIGGLYLVRRRHESGPIPSSISPIRCCLPVCAAGRRRRCASPRSA
jgi:hypothetical protein